MVSKIFMNFAYRDDALTLTGITAPDPKKAAPAFLYDDN